MYFGQIVTMTAPQIGNYGINQEDEESDGPKVAGFVVRDLSPVVSNWRSNETLDEYLKKEIPFPASMELIPVQLPKEFECMEP